MDIDNFYLIVGALGALVGSVYLDYAAVKFPCLWRSARGVYLLAGLLDLYLVIIYGLTLLGTLGIPGYGAYVRPVLLPIVMSPAAIAYINRRMRSK